MTSRFTEALLDFVNREQDTQNQQVYEMWKQPVEQRVAEGEAIDDIEVVQVQPHQAVLRFRRNLSKFRPNDNLRLSFDAPMSGFATACVLEKEEGNELVISPGFRQNFQDLQRGNGYTLDRDKVDVRFILVNMLQAFGDDPAQEARFLNMVEGRTLPRYDKFRLRIAKAAADDLGFNESQAEGFARAYAAENYHLIQGPPGTGKTWVLAHLAAKLAAEGQRVLVTAFTHRAINNALRTIGKKTGFQHVFKVGDRQHAEDLSWGSWQVNNYAKFDYSPYTAASTGFIAGGTVYALHTSRLQGVRFDTVIFDEAGQVTLPLAIGGMLPAEKAIFIGDHQQMPPVIVAEHEKKWVRQSIFETLFEHSPGTMLDTTYRMNAAVNDFPSRQFYNGRLKVYPSAATRRLEIEKPVGPYRDLLDPAQPEIFVAVGHQKSGMRSEEEAAIAAGTAATAVKAGLPTEEVAIVAPYRAQCRLIRQHLQKLAFDLKLPELTNVVVDTVERIQGQERDLVIISLVTSDPVHAAARAAFFFQPNRLNVAITRARVKRIVIGNPVLFQTRVEDPEIQAWVSVFKAMYESASILQWNGQK